MVDPGDFTLGDIVQMDDAFWGAERDGNRTGFGSPDDTPLVTAVSATPTNI